MMVLVSTEKKPSVKIFSGKLIMLRIGLRTRVRSMRENPPIRYVKMPPLTVSDGSVFEAM